MHAAVDADEAICIAANSMSALQSDVSQGNTKSPMQYVHEHEPMKVHGLTVASYGCASSAHCNMYNAGSAVHAYASSHQAAYNVLPVSQLTILRWVPQSSTSICGARHETNQRLASTRATSITPRCGV